MVKKHLVVIHQLVNLTGLDYRRIGIIYSLPYGACELNIKARQKWSRLLSL